MFPSQISLPIGGNNEGGKGHTIVTCLFKIERLPLYICGTRHSILYNYYTACLAWPLSLAYHMEGCSTQMMTCKYVPHRAVYSTTYTRWGHGNYPCRQAHTDTILTHTLDKWNQCIPGETNRLFYYNISYIHKQSSMCIMENKLV